MILKNIFLSLIVTVAINAGFCCTEGAADEACTQQASSPCIKLGFSSEGTVEIPVTMIPANEVPMYQGLLSGKTKDQVAASVDLVKSVLAPQAVIPSLDFLKFMRLATHPQIEKTPENFFL